MWCSELGSSIVTAVAQAAAVMWVQSLGLETSNILWAQPKKKKQEQTQNPNEWLQYFWITEKVGSSSFLLFYGESWECM